MLFSNLNISDQLKEKIRIELNLGKSIYRFSLQQQYQYMAVDKTYCVHSSMKYKLLDLNTNKYYIVSLTQGVKIVECACCCALNHKYCDDGRHCTPTLQSGYKCITTSECKSSSPAPPIPVPTPVPTPCADPSNCRHTPSPPAPPTPAPPTPAPPTPASPTPVPSPSPSGSNGYGQILLTYYSGPGKDTLTQPANPMNALAFAFFAPAPLANINCDFTGDDSPCIMPAVRAHPQNTLNWVKTTITNTVASLKKNLSPNMKKPIYFISFGGAAEGGIGWDSVFNDVTKATRFGTNAANLVKQIEKDTNGVATIGIDLDAEGIAQMAQFGAFAEAFRKGAAFDTYPLMFF